MGGTPEVLWAGQLLLCTSSSKHLRGRIDGVICALASCVGSRSKTASIADLGSYNTFLLFVLPPELRQLHELGHCKFELIRTTADLQNRHRH